MKSPFLLALFFGAAWYGVSAWGAEDPFQSQAELQEASGVSAKLDALVFDRQKQLGIRRANACSDSVFLRRVFLDVIGTLPTAEEAAAFLEDKSPGKRAALIDALLERGEFADYWGMRWGDILRVKSEFPVNLWPNAAQAYDRWIRENIRLNTPYSKIATEILTASGSNFRNPAVNFYRSAGSKDPKAVARAVALAFMGERAEKWPGSKQSDLAAFFSMIGFKKSGEWKEEIVYYKGVDGAIKGPKEATFPDGTTVRLKPGQDPREVFADWLISSKNSPFAASAANRIWYWLMGRGIVHEPDDMRAGNPPSNPKLLALLAREFADSGYDTRHLFRVILNSNTYQLSSIPPCDQPKGAEQFASYPLRRLEAEVLIDAINQISGSHEQYSSMIPEPFTFLPEESRSVTLPDGSITGSFLEIFGRPPRDTGLLSERGERTTTAQRLHLLNSGDILGKISKSEKLNAIFKTPGGPKAVATKLYLTILSRYPTDEEWKTVEAYTKSGEAKGGWKAMQDLAWALLNSPEFVFRH
jgi:hypothetical protein